MGYQWKIRTEFPTRKTLSFWVVKLGNALPKNRKFGAKHLECRTDFLAHVNGVLFLTLFIFFSKTLGNWFIKLYAENLKFTAFELRYIQCFLEETIFKAQFVPNFLVTKDVWSVVLAWAKILFTYRQHIWTISLNNSSKDCSYFVGLSLT